MKGILVLITSINSYVENRSCIFHEDIPILGTDLTLHYATNRTNGYKSVVTIPVSGATVPSILRTIIVKMEVAGRIFQTTRSHFSRIKKWNMSGTAWITLAGR